MRSSRRSALAIGKQLIGVNIQESIETVDDVSRLLSNSGQTYCQGFFPFAGVVKIFSKPPAAVLAFSES